MTEIDNSYQTDVGMKQEAGLIFLKETGVLKFYDSDYTGEELRNFFRSANTQTLWSLASVSLVSGADISTPPTLSPAYGNHNFKVGILMSKGSIDIREAYKGDFLIIDGALMGSTASMEILQTGINSASLYTVQGSRISSILFLANDNSQIRPRLKMVCSTDGQWSVVEANATTTIQAE